MSVDLVDRLLNSIELALRQPRNFSVAPGIPDGGEVIGCTSFL